MAEALAHELSLAIGVALSPLPIIAVTLLLVTPRARTNGPVFVLGWLFGLSIVGAIVLLAASPANAGEEGAPATWVSLLELALAGLLVVVALRQWGARPRRGRHAPAPKWMGAFDSFTAPKALGAGALLAGANPMNLLLAVAAAVAIAQSGIPAGQQAAAYALFALVGTLGVGVPVAIYFGRGERAGPLLGGLKTWMGAHNAAIMTVLCLVVGAKLLGEAIAGLSA